MSTLVAICHHRWSAPVLAELLRARGARFVELGHRLGVGRESLRRTLAALTALELVRRNPGYGHPLRPEYLLTEIGVRAAASCAAVVAELRRLGLEDVGLRKWSLPVLVALAAGEMRFSELRGSLAGVTSRALALTLKDLEAAGLVERRVTAGYPPGTVYRLTPDGAGLAAAAAPLAAGAQAAPDDGGPKAARG